MAQNKPDKKPKKPLGAFSFCPKHNVFFHSCGCKWKKTKAEKEEEEMENEIEKTDTNA